MKTQLMMLHIENMTYLAAYLLSKAPGKSLDRLKLLKLLYLADRASIEETGFSISMDNYCLMKMGPVLSETYDIIKAAAKKSPDTPEIWDDLIITDEHQCSLRPDLPEPIRLSEFNEGIADQLWAEHGHKTGIELTNFTHSLPEWQDPGDSSIPLSIKTILKSFDDYDPEDAQYYQDEHERQRLSMSYFDNPA